MCQAPSPPAKVPTVMQEVLQWRGWAYSGGGNDPPREGSSWCSGRPQQEHQNQPSRRNHTPSETASSSSPGCSPLLAAESGSGPSSGRSDTGCNLTFCQQEAPQSQFSTFISHLLLLQHLGQLLKTISPPSHPQPPNAAPGTSSPGEEAYPAHLGAGRRGTPRSGSGVTIHPSEPFPWGGQFARRKLWGTQAVGAFRAQGRAGVQVLRLCRRDGSDWSPVR